MTTSNQFFSPLAITGTLISVQGTHIVARLPQGSVGDLCWIRTRNRGEIRGQILSFHENNFSLALFDDPEGIFPGAQVRAFGSQLTIPVSKSLLGQVVSPLGIPLNNPSHLFTCCEMRPLLTAPPLATTRPLISETLITGIRSIDGFCRLGKGQRMAICAPAGVGKSTLLGMIARRAEIDVIVVALVGERSREVKEFIEETLGTEGLRRSVVVVATSSDSSLLRQTAPYTATTIAEYFRDQGMNVLLIVDSLTRLARAIRETSLAAGDLPVRHGYTNAVYTQLPRLMERAGTSLTGSITGLYTVLTNTEDDIDPLADEVKSLLDGHLVLSNQLAMLGIRPAIDITQSVSRLFTKLSSAIHQEAAHDIRRMLSRFIKERELALLGGTPDRELHSIIQHQKSFCELLAQEDNDVSSCDQTEQKIRALVENIKRDMYLEREQSRPS